MKFQIPALLAVLSGSAPLLGVILPGIDRTVSTIRASEPTEPDLATLILPVTPTVMSLVESDVRLSRFPTRLADQLPRFEAPRNLVVAASEAAPTNSWVSPWNLALNSSFASLVYDRFDAMGVTKWTERLEIGMEYGRAGFRQDSFATLRDVESFRTSVEQRPAYSYGAPGF